jgi:putative hydrolase of the HAD superfamily
VIRAVIIDYGGVLAMPPSRDALARLQSASGFADPETFLRSWRQHRPPYDRGEVTADEFWRRVGSDGEHGYDPAIVAQLRLADAECWSLQNSALVSWLDELRAAALRVALLSNMPREQWASLRESLAWLSLCDVVALSYELGIAKPDPDIYRRCLDQLACPAREVLFVDDDPENVDAAARLGINTVLFTAVDELRFELASRFDGIPLPPHDAGEGTRVTVSETVSCKPNPAGARDRRRR